MSDMIDTVAEAITEMEVEELQTLSDLIKELIESKEIEDINVNIGDMVEFEPKKGITVEGVVTDLTPKRVKITIHSGTGTCSAPVRAVRVTYTPQDAQDTQDSLDSVVSEGDSNTDPQNINTPEDWPSLLE